MYLHSNFPDQSVISDPSRPPITFFDLTSSLTFTFTACSIREDCDAAEAVCPHDLWTIATYKQLLFIDQNSEA